MTLRNANITRCTPVGRYNTNDDTKDYSPINNSTMDNIKDDNSDNSNDNIND